MSDVQRIFVAQGLRAFAYGFGSVLLGRCGPRSDEFRSTMEKRR